MYDKIHYEIKKKEKKKKKKIERHSVSECPRVVSCAGTGLHSTSSLLIEICSLFSIVCCHKSFTINNFVHKLKKKRKKEIKYPAFVNVLFFYLFLKKALLIF